MYRIEDVPVGSMVTVDLDGRAVGEVTEIKEDTIKVGFLPSIDYQGHSYTHLWLPLDLIKEVVKSEEQSAAAPDGGPNAESAPSSTSQVTRPCKWCHQPVDVTGLKGRQLAKAMQLHRYRECPAAPPRKAYGPRRPRVVDPSLLVDFDALPDPSSAKSMDGLEALDALPAVLKKLVGIGLRFRLEITNAE